MSYPIVGQPPAAGPARRPAAVTAAAALLVVMAVAGVAYAVVGVVSLNGIVDRFRSAAAGTAASGQDIDGVAAALWVGLSVAAAVNVGLAALLTALAVGNLRGGTGARVATWIVCGLGALFGCCAFGIVVGQRVVPIDVSNRADVDLLRALTDAYPRWWVAASAALSAMQVLGYLVVALLLALPPATAYFRHRRAGHGQHPHAAPPQSSTPPPPPAHPSPPPSQI
ncbi:MAG TPA: hypothetical protein VF462_07940 [Micromonosporaceae bacterium]